VTQGKEESKQVTLFSYCQCVQLQALKQAWTETDKSMTWGKALKQVWTKAGVRTKGMPCVAVAEKLVDVQ
jgi:hypothetical protein